MNHFILMILLFNLDISCIASNVCGKDILCKYNLDIESENESWKLENLNHPNVAIYNSNISHLTATMLLQMPALRRLTIKDTQLPGMYVTPQLEMMIINNCSTSNVVIEPKGDYQIKYFGVKHCKLRELPDYLNALMKLEKLYLPNNEIEFVDLIKLSGMINLKILSLSDNKIMRLSYTMDMQISLPQLQWFEISKNQLIDLDFKTWNAPSLQKIDLQENRLVVVGSLVPALPALEYMNIYDNPLNCQWMEWIISVFESRGISIMEDEILTCDKEAAELAQENIALLETFATIQQVQQIDKYLFNGIRSVDKNLLDVKENLKTIETKFSELEFKYNAAQEEILQLKEKNSRMELALQAGEAEIMRLHSVNNFIVQSWKAKVTQLENKIDQLQHTDDELAEALYLVAVDHAESSMASVEEQPDFNPQPFQQHLERFFKQAWRKLQDQFDSKLKLAVEEYLNSGQFKFSVAQNNK